MNGPIRRDVEQEALTYGFYKWYDNKGIVHYTQKEPPADAKNEDGSPWWKTGLDQGEEKELRKQRVQQARLKIKKGNPPVKKDIAPVKENVSQEPEG